MAPLVGRRSPPPGPATSRPSGSPRRSTASVLESVEARGKHLLVAFDNGRILHSHLRMTGAWHVYRDGRGVGAVAAQRLADAERERARGRAVRRPGARIARRGARRPPPRPAQSRARPARRRSPDRRRRRAARAKLRTATRPIGEVLLDQTVAAGIGNVVRCEALYALRVDPWAPLGGISDETLDRAPRAFAPRARRPACARAAQLPKVVYGARRCRRCGGAVRRRGQGDEARIVHWCPACQILCN